MKAYLINPTTESIEEVEYSGDFRDIAKLIHAELFDVVTINSYGDAVYVDDEGLINGNEFGWFKLSSYPQPLKGFGLVLGLGKNGDSVEPCITIDELRSMVTFLKESLEFV